MRKNKMRSTAGAAACVVLVLAVLLSTAAAVEGRLWVKRAADRAGDQEAAAIAKKNGYRALAVLEDTYSYMNQLKDENEKLQIEKECIEEKWEQLEAVLLQGSEEPEESEEPSAEKQDIPGTAEHELLCVFSGERGETGGILENSSDDTLVYMQYVPGGEGSGNNAWEPYERLEVDMYKRNGEWDSNNSKEVVVQLPESVAASSYKAGILLRYDAYRKKTSEEPYNSGIEAANGGTVILEVEDKEILKKRLRLNGDMGAMSEETFLCGPGSRVRIRISPEENTHFFSFAVCFERIGAAGGEEEEG